MGFFMNSRNIFYKFFSIFISLNLAFVSAVVFYYVPVYASSTNQSDDWFETVQDYLRDCLFQLCADCGIIVDLAIGDADSAMENFYIHNYLLDKTYKEYIEEHFVSHDDGTATIDAELYQFLLDFIEANKDPDFVLTDYIIDYYPNGSEPGYELFGSRYSNYVNWFKDYTLPNRDITGADLLQNASEGKTLLWTDPYGYYLWYFDYTEYPDYDNIICVARNSDINSSSSHGVGFWGYDSELNSFTYLPHWLVAFNSSGGVYNIYQSTGNSSNFMRSPVNGSQQAISKSVVLCSYAGQYDASIPYYYGNLRFPIYTSTTKWVEYNVKFQDYQKDLDYVINEDNSITINNYYYGGGSSTDPIDYTQYLQYILSEIQAVNSSISNLDMNCDHSVMESYLQSMNNQLTDLYSLLALVVSKMDANASDYSDIVDSLDALSSKLDTINNSINNPDYTDVTDRLDSMEGTVEEMKDLISDQNSSISDIKETITNMDGNISEINITIQNLSSSINDQFLSITKNGFKDVVDQLEELNDNLVALSRALVGKDMFEDSLSGVKSNFPDPDDIILASVNELAELQEEALSFGGALGDIFSKLLDFQTGIDDLVQDEEYIDEVEDLLRQLLPKDPEDNEDDSFFDKILKTIEMSLQLYANSVDEIKETSKKKFPFSIGYDIELLLMLLSAEPQTPVFTIPFEYGRINYKSDIVIDFSMFDDSIDVIRFFLTIYYCFFLLMITPKMIGLNNEVDT